MRVLNVVLRLLAIAALVHPTWLILGFVATVVVLLSSSSYWEAEPGYLAISLLSLGLFVGVMGFSLTATWWAVWPRPRSWGPRMRAWVITGLVLGTLSWNCMLLFGIDPPTANHLYLLGLPYWWMCSAPAVISAVLLAAQGIALFDAWRRRAAPANEAPHQGGRPG